MMMSNRIVDASAVLTSLREKRRVFHSEADFQFAFGWEIKSLNPRLEIRLETHPKPNVRLDLQVIDPERAEAVAIELKYLTRGWSGSEGGETFALKHHSALDGRRYDVLKDIGRVEQFIEGRVRWTGYAVVLTNDAGYWTPPRAERASNDRAFRIHDGLSLAPGSRSWVALTASTKNREHAIELRGEYPLRWTDYSQVDDTLGGKFRALVVPIGL